MDDLLGLSWDQKGSSSGNGSSMGGATTIGQTKVKPIPPPPTSKPVHLQMGLSKTGFTPTTTTSSLSSQQSSRGGMGMSMGIGLSPTPVVTSSSSPSSSIAPKKNADDVFGSLMPSFGQNSATKNLNSMTLEERRRYDQQQQQQQQQGFGSLSSSPARSLTSSSSSSSFSQPGFSSIGSSMNGAAGSSNRRGYEPTNTPGSQRSTSSTTTTSLPQPSPQTFVSPTPKLQLNPQTQNILNNNNLSRTQSPTQGLVTPPPGGLGRSLSPSMVLLQPERSNNVSPSGSSSTNSKDPFDALLGDQISRNSPSLKNQSLNAIRYNTPPLGQSSSSAPKTTDPWDLDFLANATSTKSSQPVSTASSDVFDLGGFEKALPEKPTRQRDSIDALNSFVGKQPSPISTPSPRTSPTTSKKEQFSRSPPSTPKVSSREDGDIAQIVAMGFSVERAKLALAMTEGGRDIEAAIDYLIQNDEAEDQLPQRRRTPGNNERRNPRPQRDEDDLMIEERRRRNQRQGQESSTVQQLQQHKDKIIGTASVFGMSVLSKANEIYKQGREKVQSVMEDMSAEEPRSTGARRHEWVEDKHRPRAGGYKDSDSDEDEVYSGRRQQQREQEQRKQQQQRQQQQRPRQEKEGFEDTYVSSSRRQTKPTPNRKQSDLFSMDDTSSNSRFSSTPKASTPTRTTASSTPSPLPPKPTRPQRVLVQASSQQLSESNSFKEKGNEVFKLGQFGQAAEHYSRASQALPSGHLLLIVTQNNRAAALLKIGEYRETVSECDRTVLLIQGSDGQGHNDVLPASVGVNLKDQLGKALMRRATAYENLEKYKEAKDDWVRLKELEPGHRNAAEGHRRCEKALAVMNGTSSPPVVKKAAVSSSISSSSGLKSTSSPMQDIFASHQQSNNEAKMRTNLGQSEGVSKLRQTAALQEKEEDEKLRLRDQVDQKMTLWKAGKEDNVRALIASLGSVLWEGAGWKAVGMHELVTPAQVKVKYMRAIGKVHPDKLNSTTTVEQRMMANTIFSTLNHAWDAFKAQNNI
ncbi:hypothetical protein BGZ46_000718 [Entomortierella lignicola]|nr:hypothetical protein BGZ46_000718 [Entomortierella lignicola]